MPLPSPDLDDRDFSQLVEEAVLRVRQSCPEWTDLSAGDPGMVLLELFAHLTETMIYRLNRLPEKAYVEFLNLIGVRLQPPSAAVVTLRFSRSGPGEDPIEIPAGTRVTVGRSSASEEPPIFSTARTATIAAGETAVEVVAYHCDLVEGELAGLGTGLAGLSLQARQPPIIAPTGDELDLVVGVESPPGEREERVPAREYGGKVYRIWRGVDNFTYVGPDPFVYTVDRLSGTITFAPAARVAGADGTLEEMTRSLAAIPAAGREIRLWYRRGGGGTGNVAAETLKVLKDPIPGVAVTNPAAATGGRAAESVDNALIRGPQDLHALERVVTARDFESRALRAAGAVARARAITQSALWAHAVPGTVEVLLVPYLGEERRGPGQVTVEALQAQQTASIQEQIQRDLDARRPLGTVCVVNWARYKAVRVSARIVVRRQENEAAVRQRVLDRLYGTINPLPTSYSESGWPFGQSLRASHVYDVGLAEPGVLWVDQVRMQVDDVPEGSVRAVAADAFQAKTWYVGCGDTLFRSLDEGEGWERVGQFAGEEIEIVRPFGSRAGLLAVVTRLTGEEGSRIRISRDCGESWEGAPTATAFEINDVDWTLREGVAVLLMATDAGLYEYALTAGSSPVQVLVDPQDPALGLYAVAVAREVRGQVSVAVAAQQTKGCYLSHEGGKRNTFRQIGLQGEDIRVLAVQYDNVRTFLWAGAYAAGPDDPGKGCFRRELLGSQDPPEGWQPFGTGWEGGSCRGLTFLGTEVLAASHRMGVLRLDPDARPAQWGAPDVRCGLPLRDPGRFQPVMTVAARPGWVMAGTEEGVFRSQEGSEQYESASAVEFADKVTLPPTWLFCSGAHEIEVVSEDEAE